MRLLCFRRKTSVLLASIVSACVALAISSDQTSARQAQVASTTVVSPAPRAVLNQYCITCHSQKTHTAGLDLETLDLANSSPNEEVWEKIIMKLRAGSMPPPGNPRPDPATYHAIASALENKIDRAWEANPNPGRIGAVQRLNRAEYNNAIRDLLALDVDVKPLLPGDDTADGSFDNFADSLSISTAHLERYMSVARQVTRLATGLPPASPAIATFEIPLHVIQDDRQSEDLPFGSRGGIAVHYEFPVDGEYSVKVRLQRQYQDYLKGMGWAQQLDVRLDGKLLKRFFRRMARPRQTRRRQLCRRRRARFCRRRRMGKIHADWRRRGAAGPDSGERWSPHCRECRSSGSYGNRKVFHNPCSEAGLLPTTRSIWIMRTWVRCRSAEPYKNAGPAKDTPSRRAIFICQPQARFRKNTPAPQRFFQK